jgi:hypothetical protein
MTDEELNRTQQLVLSGTDTEWRTSHEIAKRGRAPRYQTPYALRTLFQLGYVERRKEHPYQNFLWRRAS